MTCQDAREWLSDLLDEALESDRRVEVETHLTTCAECRVELDRLRATVGALRGLERARAPVGFVDRVMQRVHPTPWYRRVAAWLFLPLSVKLPAEAAAVVVIAGLAMLVWERTPELRSAARQELTPPSAPSVATVEPMPRAPSPTPPAPTAASRPSTSPRARLEELPRSLPPSTEEAPAPPAEAKAVVPPVPEAKVAAPPAFSPTPQAKMESEVRTAPGPQPLARPGSSAAQSDRSEFRARSAPQAVRRALAPASPSDLAGRLVVRDRDVAAVAVVELLSRIGGHEVGRRQDAEDTVIDVQLPAARYDEFVRGLDALGSWTAAGRPNVLPLEPPQIRMTIRLTG